MSKVAILNDTHLGIRNSSDIFLDNAKDFYSKVFFPYCKKHDITEIIHLGDYYDNRKAVNIKSLYHNRKAFLEPLRDMGMRMDIIPGNHDVYFKNTNEINSLKELLGFFMNEVNIIMKPKVMTYGKVDIAMIPWINQENYKEILKFIKNCKADILAGHLELQGFELSKGVISKHGMSSDIFKDFELVLSGHFHTNSFKDNIYYLGSQMEFTWIDANDTKYFHVLDTETRDIEKVENPYTMFKKVVYNDTAFDYNELDLTEFSKKYVKIVVEKKSNQEMLDSLVERLQDKEVLSVTVDEDFQEFLGEEIEDSDVSVEETSELLKTYVQSVDTELDKDILSNKIYSYYKQAQLMEI